MTLTHTLKTLTAILLLPLSVQAQTARGLHHYDETNSNLEGHTTQILQDRSGLLWISTWNGIYRFDGYEFRSMKPGPDDNCSMTSDRIRDIWLSEDGNMYVRNDETLFHFDLTTYRFRNLRDEQEQQEAERQRDNQPTRGQRVNDRVEFMDPQGLEWHFFKDALYCMSSVNSPAQPLPMEQPAMVRCLFMDSHKRVWMATKEDATVRLLTAEGQQMGYLTPQGTLSRSYCSFGHPVYSITETSDGHLWIGSKPDGLFRLTERGGGDVSSPAFSVEQIRGLENASVYGAAEDGQGRLWVATLGSGLACLQDITAKDPTVLKSLPGYPDDVCQRVRHVHITRQGALIAATTEGLMVGKLEADPRTMAFRRHTKDPVRPSSLSCNATMDIAETIDNRIFIATETGGINEIKSVNLLADTLSFRHLDMANGLMPTDMTIGMTLTADGHLMVTSNTKIAYVDIDDNTYESLSHHFFRNVYHFSEARPLLLPGGSWLFGTLDGAFLLPQTAAHHSNYQPPLLLTAVTYANDRQQLAVASLDTLRLQPSERSITLQFAALDYVDPQVISYQYRLGTDSTSTWTNLGHSHSISLLDLSPGTYILSLRSTNADGVWTNNTRTLTIIAEPTFWETPWGRLLVVLAVVAILAFATYTYIYIKRINRRQQDTLQMYLALLDKMQPAANDGDGPQQPAPADSEGPASQPLPDSPDPFMQRVLAYVEENLGDSKADIGQMAEACAVSRSVLQRKMKQLMGVTPVDFLREARLKRACQLLRTSDATVAEIAYNCGFSDPKYFSRCFRQSVGMSPTEYKGKAASDI